VTQARDLRGDPKAIRVRKRPLQTEVAFAHAPGEVLTLEGPVRHAAGDAILTGVQGERWPIGRAAFDATYEPVPPTRAGEDGRYRKRPLVAWARRLDAPVTVEVGPDADPISGGPGDWLVQYGPGEFGIVAAGIFAETYEPV
jgi:hypothetical protein